MKTYANRKKHFLMEMFLALLPMVYIFLSLFVLLECVLMLMTSTTETKFLTAKLLKQGCGCRKIRKAFSKFYHRHSGLIVKYNIGLKTLLQQRVLGPVFCGGLVCEFRRIVGEPNFSDQFKKIVKRYKRVGYNLDIMPSFKPNHGL